mgnify:CR=1 FL=1
MKLNPNSTRPQIFEHYEHPWYKFESQSPIMKWDDKLQLIKPNPPSKESIERAKFVDKTYHWSGGSGVRSRDRRSSR